jgi:serine/threonine-protein kinase
MNGCAAPISSDMEQIGGYPMLPVDWLRVNFPDLSNIAPIGVGGQKFVYSCSHPSDGEVVLKIIHPNTDQVTVDREVYAVEQVQSSRVPKIYETGHVMTPVGNCFWIREQRVEGTSLRTRLHNSPLTPQETLRFATQMLETLADAERVQIVHRDVKPENVMVDGSGDFWLLDFGIARHLTMRSLTANAMVFGKFTLGYAPSEQMRNLKGQIDNRADLFALGVTVVECATGQHPFRHGAANDMEILQRTENVQLPRLLLGLKDANGFADLVEVMTKKRRDHRCLSVQDALDWARQINAAEQAP